MSLTHLSLFSGIGGLDLAAEMAGFQTVGQCEWADYPTKVLEKHWPDVPWWRDIRDLTKESFYDRTGLHTVDVISGGFPCQPFSVAGKRRGKNDDRYLWPEMLRVIQEIRPAWVVGENVAGIVNLALDTVLSDLENIGYACQALIIPACAVDASHERKRCAIIAYSNSARREKFDAPAVAKKQGKLTGVFDSDVSNSKSELFTRTEQCAKQAWSTGLADGCPHVSDADDRRGIMRKNRKLSAVDETERCRSDNRGGTEEHVAGERRTTEPRLGGVVDGVPSWMDRYWVEEPDMPRITTEKKNRADRLKCLGNAVYWRQFYPIFQAISEVNK